MRKSLNLCNDKHPTVRYVYCLKVAGHEDDHECPVVKNLVVSKEEFYQWSNDATNYDA